jgi:hypothetical protein
MVMTRNSTGRSATPSDNSPERTEHLAIAWHTKRIGNNNEKNAPEQIIED